MKDSIKGALWSGLVFPGLGQVILKHYKRGIVLMLMVFAILMAITIQAVQYALTILENINLDAGVIDLKVITDAAIQASSASDSLSYNLEFLLIAVCWIFGIVDAYRIGRKKDLEGSGSN